MWELVYQLLEQELNNIIPLTSAEVEGHYDTNVSSANQSHRLCPFFNNIINNHDDVYCSGISNCDDYTEKVGSSTVKCVSSENNNYYFIRMNVKKMLEVVLS